MHIVLKKTIFLSFAFFVMLHALQGQQWVNTGDLPGAYRYEDVYFHDPMLGWTVSSSGKIYRTSDGGTNWIKVYDSNYYLRSVEFLSESIGFVGSLDGAFLRTDDGGYTWENIKDSIPGIHTGICGLYHLDNFVYGVGIWSHPAYFIKSADGGTTWTSTDMSEHASGLVDCHFLNENIGYVSGILEPQGGVILRTIDGGNTWEKVFASHGGMEYVWKMFFVNGTIGYASIESFIDLTSIAKTTDGGQTWTQLIVSPTNQDIQGIGFINENKGWVGPRDHPMFETNDGGETWEQLTIMPNVNRFFNIDGVLYASGSEVYKYDENISATSDPKAPIIAHEIVSIYPNPFSDHLEINLRIDRETMTRLDLLRSDGGQLISIYAGKLIAGNHQFKLSEKVLKQVGNNIYHVILRTDEGFQVKSVLRKNN